MLRARMLTALSFVVCGSIAAYAFVQWESDHSTTLGSTESYTLTKSSPSPMTAAEIAAMEDALWNGGVMPQGLTIDDWKGKVKLIDTGMGLQTGERWWVVTIKDDPDDLSVAKVYLDGQLVQTATQANGLIIERAGVAFATLNFMVPAVGEAFDTRMEWISVDGGMNAVNNPVEGW